MTNYFRIPGLIPAGLRRAGCAALFLIALFGIFVFSAPAYAEKDPVYTTLFSDKAAGGYDVVAYFSESKPVEGSSDFETSYKGATWQFSSQENLDRFKADPEQYAPRYGGYCAWALANGDTAKGDPAYWSIVDGKLYLNYNQKVQRDWLADRDSMISRGDANWPAVLDN